MKAAPVYARQAGPVPGAVALAAAVPYIWPVLLNPTGVAFVNFVELGAPTSTIVYVWPVTMAPRRAG